MQYKCRILSVRGLLTVKVKFGFQLFVVVILLCKTVRFQGQNVCIWSLFSCYTKKVHQEVTGFFVSCKVHHLVVVDSLMCFYVTQLEAGCACDTDTPSSISSGLVSAAFSTKGQHLLLVSYHGWVLLTVASWQPGTLAPATFTVLGMGSVGIPETPTHSWKHAPRGHVTFQEDLMAGAGHLTVGFPECEHLPTPQSKNVASFPQQLGALCGGLALDCVTAFQASGVDWHDGLEAPQCVTCTADEEPEGQSPPTVVKLILWDNDGVGLVLFVDSEGTCIVPFVVPACPPQQKQQATHDVSRFTSTSCSSFVRTSSYCIRCPYARELESVRMGHMVEGVTYDFAMHVFPIRHSSNSSQTLLPSCGMRLSDLWASQNAIHQYSGHLAVPEEDHQMDQYNKTNSTCNPVLGMPADLQHHRDTHTITSSEMASDHQNFVVCMTIVGGAHGLPYILVQGLSNGELLFCSLAAYGVPKPLFSSCGPLVPGLPVLSVASGHVGSITCFLEIVFWCAPGAGDTVLEDVVLVGERGKPLLVTGGADGSVRFWSLDKQSLGSSVFAVHAHTGL